MANEAVIIELPNGGDVTRYTIGSTATITKGQLLWFVDPHTVSGSSVAPAGNKAFAGFAAMDKDAADSSTTISAYKKGTFDLKSVAAPTITIGDMVVMSGANLIAALKYPELSGANVEMIRNIIGFAEETSSADEVIRVRVNK